MEEPAVERRYSASYTLLTSGLVSWALMLALFPDPSSSGAEWWILTESLMGWGLVMFILEVYRRKGTRLPGKPLDPSTVVRNSSWVVEMTDPITVWGRTLAATGGTLGFLMSTFYWFTGSGLIDFQEIVYGVSLTLVAC